MTLTHDGLPAQKALRVDSMSEDPGCVQAEDLFEGPVEIT